MLLSRLTPVGQSNQGVGGGGGRRGVPVSITGELEGREYHS